MKNACYFILKALFVLEIITFWTTDFFGYVRKRLDKKARVNFKIYDITNWNKRIYNKHISKSKGKSYETLSLNKM